MPMVYSVMPNKSVNMMKLGGRWAPRVAEAPPHLSIPVDQLIGTIDPSREAAAKMHGIRVTAKGVLSGRSSKREIGNGRIGMKGSMVKDPEVKTTSKPIDRSNGTRMVENHSKIFSPVKVLGTID